MLSGFRPDSGQVPGLRPESGQRPPHSHAKNLRVSYLRLGTRSNRSRINPTSLLINFIALGPCSSYFPHQVQRHGSQSQRLAYQIQLAQLSTHSQGVASPAACLSNLAGLLTNFCALGLQTKMLAYQLQRLGPRTERLAYQLQRLEL